MKKICILAALAAVVALNLTGCGAKVNGDSGGKVSDTAQSTLIGTDEQTDTEIFPDNSTDTVPTESTADTVTEKKDDENLSQNISQAITDASNVLSGEKTEEQ